METGAAAAFTPRPDAALVVPANLVQDSKVGHNAVSDANAAADSDDQDAYEHNSPEQTSDNDDDETESDSDAETGSQRSVPAFGKLLSPAVSEEPLSYDGKAEDENDDLLSDVAEESYDSYIRDMMIYSISDPAAELTLGDAVSILTYIAHAPPEEHGELLEIGGADSVSMCMERAKSSVDAQEWGCAAFWNLAFHPEHEEVLINFGVHLQVSAAMRLFPEDMALQAKGFGALSALTCSEFGQTAIMDESIHKLIWEILKQDSVPAPVTRWACALLTHIAEANSAYQNVLLQCNVKEVIVESLKRLCSSPNEEESAEAAAFVFLALLMLSDNNEFRESLLEGKITESLAQVLRNHLSHPLVALYGCSTLLRLSQDDAMKKQLVDVGSEAVVKAVLQSHPSDLDLHAEGERVLAALANGLLGTTGHWIKALYCDIGAPGSRLTRSGSAPGAV